ncbi:putative E3 ubiquitin-protein ligase dtx2 [Mactra antiquata]
MAAPVVVWEWQNEFGSWRPYSPQISAFLESNKGSSTPLSLGMVDPMLYLYSIDVKGLCQTRQGTGKQRPVRRTVLPSSSPLAKGITWQWEGDVLGSWCDFDIEIIEYLENCFTKGQLVIDLLKSKFMLPYLIDLKSMTQKRVETGRLRNIQRVFLSTSYPMDSSSTSSGTKRSSTGGSSSHKKSRTSVTASTSGLTQSSSISVSSSVISSSTVVSPPGFTSSVPAGFSMSASNLYNPIVNGLNSTSMMPGSHISTHRGPLTRRRYNQTVSSISQLQPQPHGASLSTQPCSLPSTSFSVNAAHNSLSSATSSPFTFVNIHHSRGAGHQSHHNNVPMFGGGPMFGFQPAGSSMTLPNNPLHTSGLNPASLLLGGNKSSRIKPSAQGASGSFVSTSNFPLPRYDRIPNFTHKSGRKTNKTVSLDSLSNYIETLETPPADEDCCICCEKLIEASGHSSDTVDDHVVYKLDKCSHMFHKLCLTAMYDSGAKDGHLQCPTCKTIYGEKVGNCPKGELEYKFIDTQLPGYEDCQTIQIIYNIHGGTQGPEHPHPGKRFTARGFPRIGYLPDCDKGRKVLQLLLVAWKRRLTFTIGSSTTTGEDNTVTWNEIHHKTELGSNYSGHGYPDPNYLDNVLLELAVHGITEKDLPSS